MSEFAPVQPPLEETAPTLRPVPENLRAIAQNDAYQMSPAGRIIIAANNALYQAQIADPPLPFNIDGDPLRSLVVGKDLLEFQYRVVDMLLLAALGQAIDIGELQDYARLLVPLYAEVPFLLCVQNSLVKDQALAELEQEWMAGTDLSRVQQFFRAAAFCIEGAAIYCGITISPLPEF